MHRSLGTAATRLLASSTLALAGLSVVTLAGIAGPVPTAGAAVGPEEEPAPDATEPRDRRGSRGSEVRMGRSPVGGADRDDHLASTRFSRMRAALPWRSRM